MKDLTPTEGARFLFERASQDDAGARYAVAVYTPSATFEGSAQLGFDGGVVLAIDAPAELVGAAEMFGKLVARAAAKLLDDGMPPWPSRVLRWRGPGRGG